MESEFFKMYTNFSLVFLSLFMTSSSTDLFNKMDLTVQSSVLNGEEVNIIVSFDGGTTNVLDDFDKGFNLLNRTQRLTSLRDKLLSNAQQSQQKIWDRLTLLGVIFKSFWITNQMFIQNALPITILLLSKHPNVVSIIKEVDIPLDEPLDKRVSKGVIPDGTWGISQINAPQAQNWLGTKGQGCHVATVDSGCRGTHEALVDNFWGTYGWYDPINGSPTPMDNNGHGTHTMGTICGAGGIGVAPGAKWSACRGCADSSCPQNALLACGQFCVCPTLPNGGSPDCSQAPDIVSNSWGGGQGQTWYDNVIKAYHAAGIIPVFSIGNSGPNCFSASSMGDNPNVIGVGATDEDDDICSFSSLGPSTYDQNIKPDVSAPGSNVLSAYNTADDQYATLSGTSMACPHVSGTIALLLAKNKNLTYDQVVTIIKNNCEQDLGWDGTTCGGTRDFDFPNNIYGYGRVDALKCAQAISQATGTNTNNTS